MHHSDKPIDRPGHDLLGRAGFALSLARSIDALAVARDGFVIGVQGEWGSGKTSLIEMVCRYLSHIEMERLSHLPLDLEVKPVPLTLGNLEEAAEIFERVESLTVGLDANDKYHRAVRAHRDGRWHAIRRALASDTEADAADRYWRLRSKAAEFPGTIIVRFSPWLLSSRVELAAALLGDLARAVGERLGADIKQAFGEMLKRISELMPVVGTGLDIAAHGSGIGALARVSGTWSAKLAERMASGPTLEDIRSRLRGSLSKLDNTKIVVIIDDLDRLTPADAAEMVSAVKSLGDLPNVVYLLSYDENKLSELLTAALQVNGREYLEKIIQYPVRLPVIDTDDLERMIDADLDALLSSSSDTERRSIQTAWYYVGRHYIQTPRDVRRFVNSFSVALAAVGEFTDPSDLFVLETIRLFEPSLYDYVRTHIVELAD